MRESLDIEIDNEDIKILENIEKNIEEISNSEKPPEILNSSICKKCTYYDLCYV